MQKCFLWLRTLYLLGFISVLRGISHRLMLKFGVLPKLTPLGKSITGSLIANFENSHGLKIVEPQIRSITIENASRLVDGHYKMFFHDEYEADSPPQWFYHKSYQCEQHWSTIPINRKIGEDVKMTWDISRFHWFNQLICAYLISSEQQYLRILNDWFEDWNTHNPINASVNWADGQECAIRLIHVLNLTLMAPTVKINPSVMIQFALAHGKRIEPVIRYAMSQDNNHGTSEAAGLFICGGWLLQQQNISKKNAKLATRWVNKGRRILQERIDKLVLNDGAFCMYSTNYHRVVLNTVSIVEVWRKNFNMPEFSNEYLASCYKAINWLYQLVDADNGDTLNLGANDGSNPYIVQHSDYRDFRPSLQLASVVFLNHKLYPQDCFIDEPLDWLRVEHASVVVKPFKKSSKILADSGIVILRPQAVNQVGFIKYPNYPFRPNQADLLHFDLWNNGENILRDGGSYSYNCEPATLDYFANMGGHNTIEIDGIEPMPRLGPFLLADWTKMSAIGAIDTFEEGMQWEGIYKTKNGAAHTRKVNYKSYCWSIIDELKGTLGQSILRWRLKPGQWQRKNNCFEFDNVRIVIESDQPLNIRLVNGYESRYYNQLSTVPVLEVKIDRIAAIITTKIIIKEE